MPKLSTDGPFQGPGQEATRSDDNPGQMSGRATELSMGLTFDDVVLTPGSSSIHPSDCDLRAPLTPEIDLSVPIVSSPMDTVTEHRLAICMAQEGGIGFIHKNFTVEDQAAEVAKVKRSESGTIVDPITLEPEQRIFEALEVMEQRQISGMPVVRGEQLVGIVTNRDLRFVKELDRPVETVMTPRERLITVPVGVSTERAKDLLHENRIEKLLVTDAAGNLRGLITMKDLEKAQRYPNANKDALGRLRVGGTVGATSEAVQRAQALLDAGADVLLVDSSHGHADAVLQTISALHSHFPDVELVGGNIATAEGAEALIKNHASAGSLRRGARLDLHDASDCRCRSSTAHGDHGSGGGLPPSRSSADRRRRNQVLGRYHQSTRRGREHSDDRLTLRRNRRESGPGGSAPGSFLQGLTAAWARSRQCPRDRAIATFRTMAILRRPSSYPRGSRGAYRTADRSRIASTSCSAACAPEWGSSAPRTSRPFYERARFLRVTTNGLREAHPHDVVITEEPPNYWVEN